MIKSGQKQQKYIQYLYNDLTISNINKQQYLYQQLFLTNKSSKYSQPVIQTIQPRVILDDFAKIYSCLSYYYLKLIQNCIQNLKENCGAYIILE
ncbi:hypothetical protein pb186bvf_015160 [Paramecium bursaria]